MKVYTSSEARQSLPSLLEQARREGEVRIRRKDGQTFVVRPERHAGSPLDVEGVELSVMAVEVVAFIRESRREM